MPWIGLRRDNTRVIPEEVADGERVYCPECRTQMFPRGPMSDGRARHFVHHSPGFSDCPGGGTGESETHLKWKSLVVSGLKQFFEDKLERCEPEVQIDTSNTESPTDSRRADVLLEFIRNQHLLGSGIVVEVQHKNKDKSIESVTHDYLSQSYSVYWADENDFSNDRFYVEEAMEEFGWDFTDKAIPGMIWPSHFTPNPIDPSEYERRIEDEQGDADSTRQSSLDVFDHIPLQDEDDHRVPFLPHCDHVFRRTRGEREFECRKCDIIARSKDGSFYLSLEWPYLKSNRDAAIERVCDGYWRVDDDDYVCGSCGKRYPRDPSELLQQVRE